MKIKSNYFLFKFIMNNIINRLEYCAKNLTENYHNLEYIIQNNLGITIVKTTNTDVLSLPCDMNNEQEKIYQLKLMINELKTNYETLYKYYITLYKECKYYFEQPTKLKIPITIDLNDLN